MKSMVGRRSGASIRGSRRGYASPSHTRAEGRQTAWYYSGTWYNRHMSEESTVKLYAATFMARREVDGQPIVRVRAGLVIALSEGDAHRDGMEGAREAFPETEGWNEHEVILSEIPRSLGLGDYLVTWDAVRNSKTLEEFGASG